MTSTHGLITALAAILYPASTMAQGWIQAASSGPSPRWHHAMAYDSQRGKTVLFGYRPDTWEWSGSTWNQVATTGPSSRIYFAMAYDSQRGRTVLFGGYNNIVGGTLADTWEWSGTAWAQVATAGPGARYRHAMAYDSQRGRTVMFGGIGTGWLGDTWEWNGTIWIQQPAFGPRGRSDHAMAYDSQRGRTVLFGGEGGGGSSYFGDTWEWNGTSWTQMATSSALGRSFTAMVYDSQRSRTVLFGGYAPSIGHLGDTREWDGSTWSQVATTGPGSRLAALAYDSQRGKTVLFGGSIGLTLLGDTWELGTPGPVTAAFATYGQSCPATAGFAPQLSAIPGSRPVLGTTLQLQLTNLPANTYYITLGVVGFSSQTFAGSPLPARLDAFGPFGCLLYVSIDLEFVLPNQSGTASWSIPVPSDPNLIGLDVFVQGAALAPGFVSFNRFSNAGHIVIGAL